jgi:hypothetical protein
MRGRDRTDIDPSFSTLRGRSHLRRRRCRLHRQPARCPHDDNDIFIVDDQHDVIDDDQHNEHDDGAGLNDQFAIEHFHDDHDRRGRVIGTRTSEAT